MNKHGTGDVVFWMRVVPLLGTVLAEMAQPVSIQ